MNVTFAVPQSEEVNLSILIITSCAIMKFNVTPQIIAFQVSCIVLSIKRIQINESHISEY